MEEDDRISPFSSLPEGCIANILSLTSPIDACRAAAVSSRFRSAAESDTVWQRFLPPDCDEIISRSDSPVNYATKKDLYFLLRGSCLLLDGGKLSFRLSKKSGKKCYMICARKLQIAWKDEPNYWTWTSLPESRFAEVAKLKHVWWLDILGTMASDMLSPNTTYAAYLVFKLADDREGLVGQPLKTTVKRIGQSIGENERDDFQIAYIVPTGYTNMAGVDDTVSRGRTDGWMEIELGEFFVPEHGGFDVQARLFQPGGRAKRGLIVEGIEVRPKMFYPNLTLRQLQFAIVCEV